ncbi:hypothetical protein MNBD_GAMMA24-2309 [hydrothermal vent metagenome]|uniref:Uncharacterized protein n=1 Tax=hydrothermal vent metagenome TaxID=652676 RepID=A0A3B1BUN9_9ZZZZ
MRRLLKLFIVSALVFGPFLNSVRADTLNMPQKTKKPVENYSIKLPGRGMTMAEVEKRFGPPGKKMPEVGSPPITRWVYEDFIVYFEYQYVIHAVATPPVP